MLGPLWSQIPNNWLSFLSRRYPAGDSHSRRKGSLFISGNRTLLRRSWESSSLPREASPRCRDYDWRLQPGMRLPSCPSSPPRRDGIGVTQSCPRPSSSHSRAFPSFEEALFGKISEYLTNTSNFGLWDRGDCICASRGRGRLGEGTIHWKTGGECVLARNTLLAHSWYMLRDTCILLNLGALVQDGVIHPLTRNPTLELGYFLPLEGNWQGFCLFPFALLQCFWSWICFATKFPLPTQRMSGKTTLLLVCRVGYQQPYLVSFLPQWFLS